jgi:hypothetical protein
MEQAVITAAVAEYLVEVVAVGICDEYLSEAVAAY